MTQYSFTVGQQYKREQVSQQAGDGGNISGNWSTGYPQKDQVTFIFANVGSPGQTGHDYDNFFDGPDLIWRGRTGSTRHQPSIQRMTMYGAETHVFWRSSGRDLFTYGGLGEAIDITDEVPVRVRWRLSSPSVAPPALVSIAIQRLPVSELNKVRPEHIFEAVQMLLSGFSDHTFAPSTDYDVLTEDGKRLPPKAVFGVAAKVALGYPVGPAHFTAGLNSPCFKGIEEAGYTVVAKDQPAAPLSAVDDAELDNEATFSEGKEKLRTHKIKERSLSASKAKKSQFKAKHGKLFCERCHLDPVAHFGTIQAESCIEVHHNDVQVQHMGTNHVTKLDMLQCLCANCHRLEHRKIRDQLQS